MTVRILFCYYYNSMMKRKNFIHVLVVVLLGLFVFINDPFGFFEEHYHTAPPLLKDYNPLKVKRIDIFYNNKKFQLYQKEQLWFIVDKNNHLEYVADITSFTHGLREFQFFTRYLLILNNAQPHGILSDMGFGENNLRIQLFSKNQENDKETEIATLQIGKYSGTQKNTMVKLASEKNIYAMQGRVDFYWTRGFNYYRSKHFFHYRFPENAIAEIKFFKKNIKKLISQTQKENQSNDERLIFQKLSNLEGESFYYKQNIALPKFAIFKIFSSALFTQKNQKQSMKTKTNHNDRATQLTIFGPNLSGQFVGLSQEASFNKSLMILKTSDMKYFWELQN